ncbi:MAG: hypothetical protein MHM6MM_002009 [Cercozoa sp. M6MM]
MDSETVVVDNVTSFEQAKDVLRRKSVSFSKLQIYPKHFVLDLRTMKNLTPARFLREFAAIASAAESELRRFNAQPECIEFRIPDKKLQLQCQTLAQLVWKPIPKHRQDTHSPPAQPRMSVVTPKSTSVECLSGTIGVSEKEQRVDSTLDFVSSLVGQYLPASRIKSATSRIRRSSVVPNVVALHSGTSTVDTQELQAIAVQTTAALTALKEVVAHWKDFLPGRFVSAFERFFEVTGVHFFPKSEQDVAPIWRSIAKLLHANEVENEKLRSLLLTIMNDRANGEQLEGEKQDEIDSDGKIDSPRQLPGISKERQAVEISDSPCASPVLHHKLLKHERELHTKADKNEESQQQLLEQSRRLSRQIEQQLRDSYSTDVESSKDSEGDEVPTQSEGLSEFSERIETGSSSTQSRGEVDSATLLESCNIDDKKRTFRSRPKTAIVRSRNQSRPAAAARPQSQSHGHSQGIKHERPTNEPVSDEDDSEMLFWNQERKRKRRTGRSQLSLFSHEYEFGQGSRKWSLGKLHREVRRLLLEKKREDDRCVALKRPRLSLQQFVIQDATRRLGNVGNWTREKHIRRRPRVVRVRKPSFARRRHYNSFERWHAQADIESVSSTAMHDPPCGESVKPKDSAAKAWVRQLILALRRYEDTDGEAAAFRDALDNKVSEALVDRINREQLRDRLRSFERHPSLTNCIVKHFDKVMRTQKKEVADVESLDIERRRVGGSSFGESRLERSVRRRDATQPATLLRKQRRFRRLTRFELVLDAVAYAVLQRERAELSELSRTFREFDDKRAGVLHEHEAARLLRRVARGVILRQSVESREIDMEVSESAIDLVDDALARVDPYACRILTFDDCAKAARWLRKRIMKLQEFS